MSANGLALRSFCRIGSLSAPLNRSFYQRLAQFYLETSVEATPALAFGASADELLRLCPSNNFELSQRVIRRLRDVRREAKICDRFPLCKVAQEIVPALLHEITRVTKSVPRVGEQQEIEVFLGLDQRLHNQQRIRWMNIVVHQSMGQEKFTF